MRETRPLKVDKSIHERIFADKDSLGLNNTSEVLQHHFDRSERYGVIMAQLKKNHRALYDRFRLSAIGDK